MFYYYHHLDFSAAECITYEECKFRFCIDERTELKDVKKQCALATTLDSYPSEPCDLTSEYRTGTTERKEKKFENRFCLLRYDIPYDIKERSGTHSLWISPMNA